jgi:hypothetical protein
MALGKKGSPGKPKTQPVKKSGVASGKEAPKGNISFGGKPAGTRGSKRGAC